MKKMFWILAVALCVITISLVMLIITSDLKRTQNQLNDKGFNPSEYPLIIDKNTYPELSVLENELSHEYEAMLLRFFEENFKKYGYKCFSSPTLSKFNFSYLKPKQDIYLVEPYCYVPGEIAPTGAPHIMFYVIQGNIVMFYRNDVMPHFTEIFNNIEDLNQLKEYSGLYVDSLAVNLDSVMNNSVFSGLNQDTLKNDCSIVSDIPELNSTISRKGDVFVYEGLKIYPELPASLYYLKYTITSDGQVTKGFDKPLAICNDIGIVY